MLYAYGREKELMMLEGASPEGIDRALQDFGMAMGPNAVGDLAGLDIGFQVRKEWQEKPDDPRFYRVSDRLAELGRFGQKSGRGFYRYDGPGKERIAGPRGDGTDPRRGGSARCRAAREVEPGEIVTRCILALVNEGARILEEGIAESAGRHRRDLVQWLWLSAAPRRPDVLRGHRRAPLASWMRSARSRASMASATGSRPNCSHGSRPTGATFAGWQAGRAAG